MVTLVLATAVYVILSLRHALSEHRQAGYSQPLLAEERWTVGVEAFMTNFVFVALFSLILHYLFLAPAPWYGDSSLDACFILGMSVVSYAYPKVDSPGIGKFESLATVFGFVLLVIGGAFTIGKLFPSTVELTRNQRFVEVIIGPVLFIAVAELFEKTGFCESLVHSFARGAQFLGYGRSKAKFALKQLETTIDLYQKSPVDPQDFERAGRIKTAQSLLDAAKKRARRFEWDTVLIYSQDGMKAMPPMMDLMLPTFGIQVTAGAKTEQNS